jgi:hypothetical protein
MIQITLNFSSIEAARAALLEIPSSVLVGTADVPKAAQAQEPAAGQATAKADAAPKKTAAAKPQAAASVAAESQASTAVTTEGNEAAATPTAASPSPTAQSASSSTPVEYPVLQKAVFTLAGKSREAAASIAAEFKVKTFKELSQDQWAAALEAVNAKLAELEAA